MLAIRKLFMDYLERPLGVEAMPQLGWILESDGANVRQTAYRVQIARDAAFEDMVLDSGRVESDESAHVDLSPELEPCRDYHVRARVWAGGEASDWSAPARFLTGMVGGGWKARFISAERGADWRNSRGTYLRKRWTEDKPVAQAVVCATALGLYHLYLNGAPVGDEKMLPGWTVYPEHLCYQTWDVTDLVRQGENVLAAHVGAGWYKGMMGFIHERCAYGDRTALLAQLTVRYADGSTACVVTDESWLGCASPVTFSEIYDGERVDMRLDQPGWNAPGFEPPLGEPLPPEDFPPLDRRPHPLRTAADKDAQRAFAQAWQPRDTLWRSVEIVDFPLRALTPQPGARPAAHEELPVSAVLTTPEGDTVLDFGQNLSGYVRFRAKGAPGELIHLRCFEALDAKGNAYFDNLRGALAEIRFICDGRETVYDEQFSFQGFRYALVAAWPGELCAEDFTACAVYSTMPETGRFECSNPLINQLAHNIGWSLRGNFLDIPTDCPQRDERLGWTGDAQIFCRTAAFLRGCYPFFEKWLVDVAAEQTPEGGVPHIVPNQLQYFDTDDWLVGQGTHSAAGWADVAVILPWTLYQVYGDKRILERQFDSMARWIGFMRDHSEDYLWSYRLQFGDWVALDAEEGSYFGATPLPLTSTAYYAYVTGLFVKICRVLGREAQADEYAALYAGIADKFRREFLDGNGVMKVQTQTAHILALYFGLIPPEGVEGTVRGLCRLLEKENGHLVTGFMGTPYFCHALSQNGRTKEAYALLLKEDFPSWLYQVKTGATTIWEHWDGLKPDGSMWSADMNSFNHYAYGAIGEWLQRVVAGIDTDESRPGYRRAVLAPQTGGGLSFAHASFESVYGEVATRWARKGERVTLTVTVPVNAEAVVILERGAESPESRLSFRLNEKGQYQAEAGSGAWTVSYILNGESR